MGWFRRPRTDPEELDQLKQQLTYMREQFDKAAGTADELHRRVEEIGVPQPPPVSADDVAAVAAEVVELRARVDVWTKSQNALSERLTAIDQRLEVVSTELANQLGELSGDIEKLAAATDGAGDTAAIDGLVAGQQRLANEQARYQIAFREDLARLADELRRGAHSERQ
jgi:tetrahydromethanopterin S-methyltransferase subunit G